VYELVFYNITVILIKLCAFVGLNLIFITVYFTC
jgi:hypothetical protein